MTRGPLPTISDEQLMRRLSEGETEMLGVLYTRYVGLVRSALIREVPQLGRAKLDELTQDVFLAVHDSVGRYREKRRLRSWLYGIAIRKGKVWRRNTFLRTRLLREHYGERVGPSASEMAGPSRTLQIRRAVKDALSALPPEQRQVLLLHSVEGFTGEEISAALGVNHRTVRTRLHRARKTLSNHADRDSWRELLYSNGEE